MTHDSSALFLVIGALHIDEIATTHAPIILGESNPVNWSRSAGGVAANVARAAASSAHLPVTLLANIGAGKDAIDLSSALARSNVRVQPIENNNRSTGRYSAIVQHTGELLVGLADVEQALAVTLKDVQKLTNLAATRAVILDTNLSSTNLMEISHHVRRTHEPCLIAALGASPSKVTRLKNALSYLDILFCNASEVRSLAANHSTENAHDTKKQLSLLCESGCKHVVMTSGKDKIHIHSQDQHTNLTVPKIDNPSTMNGPGDALAGAALGALMHAPLTHDSLVYAVSQHGIPAAAKVVTGEHKAPYLFTH